MMTLYSSRRSLNRVLSQCLSVGTLAALSLLLGFAPGLSERSHSLDFSSQAYAQTFSTQKLINFARAVLAMEPGRQAAYNEIKRIVGSPPNIACSQPNSLRSLPGNAQAIAINYCKQSQKIVQSNGLSIEEFNLITVEAQKNSEVAAQIKNEMIRLQAQ
ncbi:DUF4168 domain-containing protein [Coleofasciculus sp. FACHB-1120]|uniref:DUF4168 domain-containing protein n=1 Tax=Coleofasciculus sp. FACHB-1120 TaxID=2692783 RepID=UPI00168548A0|nr:DUF4168 domain-containing protein [Coleofasciculus sp. FACHB-1120]MBD2743348.1 DUF4168 domain-containing protein [Coleofasciculus sp. FACHB-1120]